MVIVRSCGRLVCSNERSERLWRDRPPCPVSHLLQTTGHSVFCTDCEETNAKRSQKCACPHIVGCAETRCAFVDVRFLLRPLKYAAPMDTNEADATRRLSNDQTLGTSDVQAFDFELQDIHGKTWRLADFTDDWLLMVFHRHLG